MLGSFVPLQLVPPSLPGADIWLFFFSGSDLIATLLSCGIRISQHLNIHRFTSGPCLPHIT